MNVDHHINKDPPITIFILQLISAEPDSKIASTLRDKWESIWMARLNSYFPNGMNIQD